VLILKCGGFGCPGKIEFARIIDACREVREDSKNAAIGKYFGHSLYVAYSDRVIEGSPKHSISSVPITR
jgi:hypothetical protein